MNEKRSGINYEFSWNPFPASFLSTRYYDETRRSTSQQCDKEAILDFPTIDSNAIITHWGISFFIIGIDEVHYEQFVQLVGGMSATLLINQGRVFGYSGVDFIPSAWITFDDILRAVTNTSYNIGMIRNLAPVSIPITQDGSQVRIIFNQTSFSVEWDYRLYGRVRGIYALAD